MNGIRKMIFALPAAWLSLSCLSAPRLYPMDVNVRDFGAKGDGLADDTAALQAAADHATRCAESMRVSVAGRNCKRACQTDGPMPRLVFPAGTYLVTKPVFFRRDHQIYGFGGATVKAASPNIDVFVFFGTMRHFVTGLTMEGGARQFLVETHNSESANFKVRDCVFRNASVTAVDSHSYRLPDASDAKKRITVGTYRFDKEKGAWVKDERMNAPDLKPYNNSTYFSLEQCAFYDCQRATDINPDGATFRDLKVISSVTTGCVFRVSNNLHAYDLDVTLARPKGADDLAFIDYLGAHGLLLENSRFKSADGRGICLVHSSAKPSYIANSLILRSLEVPCGGCPEGAIIQFRNRTTPEIVSVTDVNDTTERPVEAVSYADGMTAVDLDAIRRFQQVPSNKTYSIAIGRNSPNIGDSLPPSVARFREPAADVPKARSSLKVPPCPTDGEILWGPDFGVSEKASDDDTAALKRLFGEAASRRLATVVLPPRRIVLKEPVTVSGEVAVTAAGIALIEAADDCDIFRVESGSRVLLSHLFFRNGRHQLICETSSDTTVILDHCFSFDAADTAFIMTAEKGARLDFLVDGGVHYHPRWYEGNANAILAGAWLRILPPKPFGESFTESVSIINRGKLRYQDILGVPCVFSSIPKGSQAPAGDYRWIDNIGGELHSVFSRFGGEWGGIPPVYNFDGGKVLIEGSYAYFYPRFTAHAAVVTDREPASDDIRLFAVACGMEVQVWYGGAQVLVRMKPGDEPKPVRSALRRCLVPKAESDGKMFAVNVGAGYKGGQPAEKKSDFSCVWNRRFCFDAERPLPEGMTFLSAAHYSAQVEALPGEMRFVCGDETLFFFAAPTNAAPPYEMHVMLTGAHTPAVFVTKDGVTTLAALPTWPEGLDPRSASLTNSVRCVVSENLRDPRVSLSAGIGQADTRFVTEGRCNRPYRKDGRLFFTFSARAYGAYLGVMSFDPDKLDFRLEGIILFDYGDGLLRNDVAADLFYDDVAEEWRAYVSNFSTTGDVLNRRAKGGLNCAWSKACPLFGVSVMQAKSLGFEGMNEDPDGYWDERAKKWRLLVSEFVRGGGIRASLWESDRWDGAFVRVAGPVAEDSTGTTLASVGGEVVALSGSSGRRFNVYDYPALQRKGCLEIKDPPWEISASRNGRSWPAYAEQPDGRDVLLTFDRVNFPGMPKPNWTYGGLYLYERSIR